MATRSDTHDSHPKSRSSSIHGTLGHPVIDADGHSIAFPPLLEEYVFEFAGQVGVDQFRSESSWLAADPKTRADERIPKRCIGYPTRNTTDYVTSMVPALLEERLGEMGLDFTVIYPNGPRFGPRDTKDSTLRQAMCHATNTYQADQLGPHARRMTPVAVVPLDSPTEAIEELEYAINTLGMKAVQFDSFIARRGKKATWWDSLALDSKYNYDAVWQKCVELKVSPGFHTGTIGMGSRTSYTNSVYNHVGHFSAGSEAICKALVLGGVTYRFPDLHFVFLEAGISWASALYSDLVGHWKKRNVDALRDLDPENLDYEKATALFERYGSEPMLRHVARRIAEIGERISWVSEKDHPSDFDEFEVAGIKEAGDIVKRFVPNFFFGCEGDDPMNPIAFHKGLLPMNAHLNTVYGSDISHWDVPDVTEVLEEAYELVEEEKITPENFREFVFTNPIKLFTHANKEFFTGTAIEAEVAAERGALERAGSLHGTGSQV